MLYVGDLLNVQSGIQGPPPPVLPQDYYKIITGVEYQKDCYWIYWLGQTFTANKNYIIKSVNLKMRRELFPGNAVISIQRIIGGIPSGDNIAVKVFNANELPEIMGWEKINFEAGALLSSGVKYIVFMNVPDGNSKNLISWAYDSTGEYPGGNRLDSYDGGDSWQPVLDHDYMFETWGING